MSTTTFPSGDFEQDVGLVGEEFATQIYFSGKTYLLTVLDEGIQLTSLEEQHVRRD